MIWLIWRQHRKQTLFTLAAFAVLAALMIPTGLSMRSTFTKLGLPACVRALGTSQFVHADYSQDCATAFRQFNSQYNTLALVGMLLVFVPLLVGLFWGAPVLAREIEQGTHRLIWTQGVSRRRWALVKIGFVGLVAVLLAVAYGLGMSWWWTPLSMSGDFNRFNYLMFDTQGVAPIGYTLFAVALGLFAGTVWHKVLPAMAVTLTGFLGLRIALTALARPRYLTPKTVTFPVRGTSPAMNQALGDWVMDMNVRDASGKVVLSNGQVGCPPTEANCDGFGPGAYNWEQFQPGGRYWVFQGIETGIFVALAVLLFYLALRRIRRIA